MCEAGERSEQGKRWREKQGRVEKGRERMEEVEEWTLVEGLIRKKGGETDKDGEEGCKKWRKIHL